MKNLENILFLDIETVPVCEKFTQLDERLQKQWERKAGTLRNEEEFSPAELYEDRGGIYAEFGKVVAIGMGFYTLSEGGIYTFRVKSLSDKDEKALLNTFNGYLSKFNQNSLLLCAHNGKEFDFPYLSRRILINGLKLPAILDNAGKKPWEVNFLDTMELWKFGDRKNYTSLDLIAAVFNIDSSKSDIDGSEVSTVYYQEDNLEKIADYCLQDVIVTARIYQRLQGMDPVTDDHIVIQ